MKHEKYEKTEKMRIAMLGHKRIPSREGGIEVVVEALGVRMVARGHSVTCYNRSGHHVSGKEFDGAKRKEYRGIRLKTVPTIPHRGLAAMTASFGASLRAAFGKYDVVHVHAEGPAYFCWLPKLFGKRVVVTVHGLDHQRAKWGKFAKRCILAGEKNAVRYADGIIVLSESVRRYFSDTYGRETVYIPNGVSMPARRQADEIVRRFALTEDGYFLFVGRLVPEKGIHALIEAFRRIQTEKKLVISGGVSDSDEYVKSLKALAAGDDRIVFTDFVQGRALEELYSNAYVYVLPSELEGMPMSLLEAMSYGNCCLTSDISECTEVLGGYGVSFARGDSESLQNALQTLSDDRALVARYKASAAEYICKRYNWDEIVERTLALYQA